MKALSIRQPWAWLILNAGKDIENRSWATPVRGRILVHAAKGMTHDHYDNGLLALWTSGYPRVKMPAFDRLERGGIVGAVTIVDCVRVNASPWFYGPCGFVLTDAQALPFRPYRGQLGFFEVAADVVTLPDRSVAVEYHGPELLGEFKRSE